MKGTIDFHDLYVQFTRSRVSRAHPRSAIGERRAAVILTLLAQCRARRRRQRQLYCSRTCLSYSLTHGK
jgi:hypothetical protein